MPATRVAATRGLDGLLFILKLLYYLLLDPIQHGGASRVPHPRRVFRLVELQRLLRECAGVPYSIRGYAECTLPFVAQEEARADEMDWEIRVWVISSL